MIQVKVDGQPFTADLNRVQTMGELVELIKAAIDPDSIIVSLTLDGQPLSDADWKQSLISHAAKTLEAATGGKEAYVAQRLGTAENYLRQIIAGLTEVSGLYAGGKIDDANRSFTGPVKDLVAFLDWYSSILAMNPARTGHRRVEYSRQIGEIKTICDRIIQQQMFHSWPLVGEMLQSKLVPELEKLAVFCRSV